MLRARYEENGTTTQPVAETTEERTAVFSKEIAGGGEIAFDKPVFFFEEGERFFEDVETAKGID